MHEECGAEAFARASVSKAAEGTWQQQPQVIIATLLVRYKLHLYAQAALNWLQGFQLKPVHLSL